MQNTNQFNKHWDKVNKKMIKIHTTCMLNASWNMNSFIVRDNNILENEMRQWSSSILREDTKTCISKISTTKSLKFALKENYTVSK